MLSPSQANIHRIKVDPAIPESLKKLDEIARNLWWCWNYEAVNLFTKLDRELWEQTHHNPVKMLGMIGQDRLDRAAADRSYRHALDTVHSQLTEDLSRQRSWFADAKAMLLSTAAGREKPFRVAYFCAEFGLTECFQIYSGGLGALAGDHLKSASELGIPLVAIGLMYQQGYFHQYLNQDGWQQETYPDIDPHNQPIELMTGADGQPLRVYVQYPGRQIAAQIWRCKVGQVPLYLLDTNLPENSREDRTITQRLYGGDREHRLKQEILLGIGGVRALAALGEEVSVCHINEGHAAFISLQRIIDVRKKNPQLSFDEAREAVAASQIFTTHTPVPAGIDRFAPGMIRSYLEHLLPELGLDSEGLLALGRENTADRGEEFSMAVLAIRTSRFCNGVSALHGVVARKMWRSMWPLTPAHDVPIGHVTNGVHARTWVSGEMVRVYDRYLSDSWHISPQDPETWSAVEQIPDEELWDAHTTRRERLIGFVRRKLREQLLARGAGAKEIEKASASLDMHTFTIGFARRFATYKRGTLLMRDLERFKRLLRNADRPVQIIIAGKSHPQDGGGKQLIRDIVTLMREHDLGHRVVFLEDYDMQIARRMVQGCDLWLNTPIRGLEASGTSGMKAALNGVINCSILDGWWDEGFGPELGFGIGRGEDVDHLPDHERDDIDSRNLYNVLENQIVPEFYDRDAAGLPRKWIARMKRCIRELGPRFNTHRMLVDYARQFYFPSHNAAARLAQGNYREAKELAAHVNHFRAHWGGVRVESVTTPVAANRSVAVRSLVRVQTRVRLGSLRPEEVMVQLCHGRLTALGELVEARTVTMKHDPTADNGELGVFTFVGGFAPGHSGQYGFSVRVLPADDRLVTPFLPGLITWDTGTRSESVQMVGA